MAESEVGAVEAVEAGEAVEVEAVADVADGAGDGDGAEVAGVDKGGDVGVDLMLPSILSRFRTILLISLNLPTLPRATTYNPQASSLPTRVFLPLPSAPTPSSMLSSRAIVS